MTSAQSGRESASTTSTCRSGSIVALTGEDLRMTDLVAVARYNARVQVSDRPNVRERVDRSVEILATKLRAGDLVYGVNTGFGGSADTRTSSLNELQRACVQHQTSGILTGVEVGRKQRMASDDDNNGPSSMPKSWVRGMMLSRANSLLRGHSAVSMAAIEAILVLLNHDLTPVVPLRGSISASGDLQPLSYVVATLQGNPTIYVRTSGETGKHTVTAPEALKIAALNPIILQAKEGLGLLNGTAASAAAASLALHDAHNLALLSQALTAMTVEALAGTVESFDPFISAARPHHGQERASSTMRSFLRGSKLASGFGANNVDHIRPGLCQDRYALRTSPQWIGPLLEDLELAARQVNVELNSTTDNPLIDTSGDGTILHGGNFQASSITSAMEKTRNTLQQLGKMLFAQSTEINNPSMSRGLPPNLCADEPSTSFTCKGVDINMAAYASELGWLNHPVGPHVQSAEMHNQAINSLALLSARTTHQSVEVMSSMCAADLFMVCQALDLRVLLVRFLARYEPAFKRSTRAFLRKVTQDDDVVLESVTSLWASLAETWNNTTTMDLRARCDRTAQAMAGKVLDTIVTIRTTPRSIENISLISIVAYQRVLSAGLHGVYTSIRSDLFDDYLNITPTYLGKAAYMLYTFIRKDLGVPFFRGLVEDPTYQPGADSSTVEKLFGRERKSIGCWISVIYESLGDGTLFGKLAEIA